MGTRFWKIVAVAAVLGIALVPVSGQQTPLTPEELLEDTARGARLNRTGSFVPFPSVDPATSVDWPRHNFDIANSRHAPLDQINASNVGSLAVRWLYHGGSGRATPVVADGVMYLTTPNAVIALDAATGAGGPCGAMRAPPARAARRTPTARSTPPPTRG